jgi:hypothetical protein
MNEPVRRCLGANHRPCMKCPYPISEIPLKWFRTDPENPNSKDCKSCWYCRLYTRKVTKGVNDRYKEKSDKIKLLVPVGKAEYGFCSFSGHEGIVGSKYRRSEVPITMFLKDPLDLKSEIYERCCDCRHYVSTNALERSSSIKDIAKSKGQHICGLCYKEISILNRAYNIDGTLSVKCIPCQTSANLRYPKRQAILKDIIWELIAKYECSCQRCKCIYLKADPTNLVVVRIETFAFEGSRYFQYNGRSHRVLDILTECKHLFELAIIDMDHLSEVEQREQHILSPDEAFIPKRNCMSLLSSEFDLRREALKCQNLCVHCHVEVTVGREKGSTSKGLRTLKLSYTNKIKEAGCTSCGFKDIKYLRKFHLDHIDPNSKILCVSDMIHGSLGGDYSFEDVVNECSKCRVLCSHCHRIHSRNQRRARKAIEGDDMKIPEM